MPIQLIGKTVHELTCQEFLDLRILLAEAAGIKLRKMDGYGGVKSWATIDQASEALVLLLMRTDESSLMVGSDAFLCGKRIQRLLPSIPDIHPKKALIGQIADDMVNTGSFGDPYLIVRTFN